MNECNICYNKAMLKKLMDDVNCTSLAACVDCVAAAGESVADYYETFGDKLHHAHLADGFPTGHLCPGDGENPLSDYLRTLADKDYSNSITLEINNQMYFSNPDKAVGRAVNWLKNCEWVEG